MKTNSYVLVSLMLLSVISTSALINPQIIPTIPPVSAGEPAGDSILRLSCVGLVPRTPDCVADNQPFETVVYDTNANRIFDAGDVAIVGPTPAANAPLTDDPNIRYRDTTAQVGLTCCWTSGEMIFWDDVLASTADRVTLIGTPSTLGTLVEDDPNLLIVDTSGNGLLNGVIRVTARLERVGGTELVGSREDVDAIQVLYDYDPATLFVMRRSYVPVGSLMLGTSYKTGVNSPTTGACQRSGLELDPNDPLGKALTGGGSPLDSIIPDELAGRISSSHLCSESPQRSTDVGIGCDPATAGSDVDGNGIPWYFCPGADGSERTLDGPLQNLDVMNVQFLVLRHAAFTITQVSTGSSVSKITDIDGSSQRDLPVTLINAPFDNRKAKQPPIVDFAWDCEQDGTFESGKCTAGRSVTFQDRSIDPQNQILTVFSWDFQNDGIKDAQGPQVKNVFPAGTWTVSHTVCNESGLCATRIKDLVVNPGKVAPTAVLTGPDKAFIKAKVIFDGTGSHDNNVPAQPLTYSWTVDGTVVPGQTGATLSYTFFSTGLHGVSLTVCNSSLLCDTTTHSVLINPVKNAPTAVIIGPDKAFVKTKVVFDGVQSFDNSNPRQLIVFYEWTVDGVLAGNAPQLSYTFNEPRVYDVGLRVCNESGLCGGTIHIININPVKADPTAVITGPDKAFIKATVVFDGSASRDNSNPLQSLTYSWTVDGAAAGNTVSISYAFMTTGLHSVSLTVCNSSGLCNTATHSITINPVKADPTAVILAPGKVFVKEKVLYDGSASFDNSNPRQAIVSYTWTDAAGAPLGSGPLLSQTYMLPGTYTVVLTVCNESQLCASTSHTITVNAIKRDPTAVILAPDKVFVKEKVLYDGGQSRDNSNPVQQIVSYEWFDATGAPLGIGPTLSQTYMLPGTYTVTLKVCNESGLCGSTSHTVTVNPVKVAPTAVISAPDKVFVKAKVTYDGSGSFDNSNPRQAIVSYTWTDAAGAPLGSGPLLSQTYMLPGVYTVTLTVCNESNLCGSANHSVTVNAIKADPTAVLTGPDKAFIKAKVVFDGSGSFDNSNPVQSLTYSWMVDGTVVPGQAGSTLSYTFFTTGPHTVTLTVCNTSGLCSTATHSITINPVKAAPTASVTGPTKAFIKADVTFDASASRDNSNPIQTLSYSWSVDGGVPVAGGAMFTTAFFTTGLHTVTVTVCNTSGLCASASTSITINPVKVAPTAVISAPSKVFVKEKVTYDGSGSFDNSNPLQAIVSYTWTDSAGGFLGSGPILSQTYMLPGVYTVTLTVCNESNLCGSANHSVTVNAIKRDPTAVIIAPTKVFVKEKVLYDGRQSFDNSNPLQAIVSYTWHDAAGNTIGTGPTLSQTYMLPGTYTVHLLVCNESGLCGGVFHTVTVNPVKADPTVVILAPSKAFIKAKVVFDGSASRDNSNPLQSLTYSWSVDGVALADTSSTLSYTFFTTGPHVVRLTVCNTSGLCSTASHTIQINPVKADPTAVIVGPDKAFIKAKVVFDGSGSRDNSNPLQSLTYSWTVDGQPRADTGSSISVTFMTTGLHSVSLTVCNTSGLCNTATHSITINPVKADPTAVIVAPTKEFVNVKVLFDGSGSRDNSNPLQTITYSWTVRDSAGGLVASGMAATLSVTFTSPGVYTASLTVCNTSGLCGTATHTITINPNKVAPTAIIMAPSKEFVNVKVVFDGTASHDNSNPLQTITYSWTVRDSAGGLVASGNAATLSVTFTSPGVYTASLTVCNTSGLCGTATHTITINPAKNDPTAVITGPDKAFIKAKVVFDGSASRDNSNPLQSLTYSWSVDGVQQAATGSSLSFTFMTTGLHSVSLTVCNTSGLCSTATHSITINPVKAAPTASVTGPTKAFIKADVTFDASASRDNSNPIQSLSYSWSVDGGVPVAGGAMFTTAFFTTGLHTVTVTVCNTSGLCADASTSIAINPVKADPTAVITGPDKAFVKAKVVFDGSASRDNSNPLQSLTYSWTVDGQPRADTGSSISVTFMTTGLHSVSLTVCNTSGLCSTAAHSITINAVKADPTAVIVAPVKEFVNVKVVFDGTASHDNSNPLQTITYSWTVRDSAGGLVASGNAATLSVTFTSPGVYTASLTVCNTSGLCGTATHTITINPAKNDPTAVITGPDKAFVKAKVVFDGSASRDNSNPLQSLTYSWTVDGAAAGSTVSISVTFMTTGPHAVSLTVCNTSGLCNTATHSITINPVKAAPTASVTGPTKAFIKAQVTFDASASRDNSNPIQSLSYSWSVDGGVPVPGGAMFTTAFFTTGLHTVTVTVCNESSLCDTASTSISINPVKADPTAVVTGPTKAFVKEKIVFDGSGSRDNSNPPQSLTYSWTVDGVARADTGSSISVTFFTTGLHSVALTVCNTSGLCDTASTSTLINPIKSDPTAVIVAPDKAFVKEKVIFDGGASRDNSNPLQALTYSWTVDGTQQAQMGSMLSYTFFTTGPHAVTLTVCNESSLCASTTHSITINPVKNAPTASVTGPTKAFVKATVDFDASASRDNSNPIQPLSYSWSVDGGASVPGGTTFSTSFMTTGLHTVTVTVCNESMLCDSASTSILINPVKADPSAVIMAPDKAFVKEKVTYDGSGSFDNSNPRQAIVSYSWTDATGAPLGSGPLLSQTYMSPGQYTVVLTVCNESGFCNNAMHSITINAVKAAPTVQVFGPPKAFVKEKVTFDSTSFDNSNPVQQIVSLTWTVNGQVVGSGPVLSYTFMVPGTYTVTLTACNESMLCGSGSTDITVNAVKNAPTAVVTGPTKAFVKEKVVFDGSQSRDSSNPLQALTYSWTVDGQPLADMSSMLSYTFFTTGLHTVDLTVCNESMLCDSASTQITINAVKADPTAVIMAPAKGTQDVKVLFDGSGSRDNSNPAQSLTYEWTVRDSAGTVIGAGNMDTLSFTFTATGTYTVTLTVCNESMLCNTATHTILINPPKQPLVLKPITVCTVIGDPTCNVPPIKVTGQTDLFVTETQEFTVSWTGGTGPFTCTFDFGDGSAPVAVVPVGQSCTATHVYTLTGTFTVSVNVLGQNPGDDQTATKVVQLNPEPRFFHGKLSWKHHLVSPAAQPFSGKATNPGTKTVLVRIDLVVDMPNGMQDFCKDEAVVDNCTQRTFTLAPGGSNTNMAFTYTPGDGLGKYCFDATLSYGIDQNGNGLLEQSEVLGTDGIKSGCFNYV